MMILNPRDTERFYKVWFPLLAFVNDRLQLVADFPHEWLPGSVSTNDAITLRNALWADDGLREAFVAANPAGLDAPNLALVASWQTRISGNFYFFRQLKKYAIFIPEHGSEQVYAVLGLFSPFEEVVPLPPPALVQTTLLPFEGKIIYDGLMVGYNILFGPGIRASLNEIYRTAKERGALLTSLEQREGDTSPRAIRSRNARLLAAFQKELARSNMSLKTLERHQATIERFAEQYLLQLSPPHGLIELNSEYLVHYLGSMGDDVNLVSFKHFVRFLRDSGRVDWYAAEAMLDELRG